MDQKIKEKWLTALRSGEYKQADSYLYDDEMEGYCCLGVLMCVQGAKPQEHFADLCQDSNDALLRSDVPEPFNAGLSTADMDLLALMNDGTQGPVGGSMDWVKDYYGKKQSFQQIAEYIEKNF